MGCDPGSGIYTNNPSVADMGYNRTVGDLVNIGCYFSGSTTGNINCPSSGGWEAVDTSYGCNFCTGANTRGACKANGIDQCGGLGTIGSAVVCRLQRYTGNQSLCATVGFDSGGTCDPKNLTKNLTPDNGSLDSIMSNYCTMNSCQNWGTTTCQQWINVRGSNNQTGQQAVASYCSLNDNIIGDYCVAYASNNPGVLDAVATNYCHSLQSIGDASLDESFCACLNLNSVITNNPNLQQIALNPACYCAFCSNGATGAYQTLPQQTSAKNCSPITICAQTISVGSITNSSAITLNNTCEINGENTTTTTVAPVTNNQFSMENIVIVLIMISVCLGFGFIFKTLMQTPVRRRLPVKVPIKGPLMQKVNINGPRLRK